MGEGEGRLTAEWTNELALADSAGKRIMRWVTKGTQFAANGTTTTCEALWMGKPVVTLAGEMHMSRVGATLLESAGLDDLVATSAENYVQIAIDRWPALP